MKAFMDKEFMLQSPVAQHLYHTYAADMPICDYHCHISPKEIYENRRFENIAQVWLAVTRTAAISVIIISGA